MSGHARIRATGVAIAVWLAWGLPPAARAETAGAGGTRVYGSSTTILTMPSRVIDPNDPTSKRYLAPFYEYLTVGADDVGTKGFSIAMTGFGMVHVTKPVDGDRGTGDVLVGTVSYRHPKGWIEARLGRQILYQGAGMNTLMDGIWLSSRPGADLDLSAFGGFVPNPRFSYSTGRVIYGGRVAWDPWEWGRLGVSFVEERAPVNGTSEVGRSNLGVDYALRRWKWVDFTGYLVADLFLGTIQETQNAVTVFPHRDWRVSVDYGMVTPAGRLLKTSIFSIFNEAAYHAVGAEVAYRGGGWLQMDASGRALIYDGGDPGYQVTLRPRLQFKPGFADQVGLELSRVASPDNAYWQARAFGVWQPVKRLDLTADVDNYVYDHDVRGYGHSHIVGLSAGYEVFRGAKLQGDFLVSVTPDFSYWLSGMVKFTYAFSTHVK